ncbi:MAG: hypothetical protein ACI9W2_003275, partial [Gammaproteobacteria bacterium]
MSAADTEVITDAEIITDAEVINVDDMDPIAWNEFAFEQGWGDGLPLMMPTPDLVQACVATVRGDNEPLAPVSPRQVTPTFEAVAANAVMAGCKPAFFPVVLGSLRAVLAPEYNLHGTLATTHSCAPMVMVSGPGRDSLGINFGSNCFGQGTQANATIGRALALALLNIGGARPGEMDRSTQGTPAKYSFCFGENEADSPWPSYSVRRGFAAEDTVVTVMAGEAPHNINDHASNTAHGLLTTFAQTIATPGANTIYAKGPYFVLIGPEHAATFARDGLGIDDIRAELFERSRVPLSRVSHENQRSYEEMDRKVVDGHYYLTESAEDIHVAVAGGPGKHSAFIPSFGGTAAVCVRI